MMLEHAAVEQHLDKARKITRGREEASMGSDPPESEGVLVVDLAANHATPPGIELGGGDSRQKILARSIERIGHRQGLEHPLSHELVQRPAGDPGQYLAEEDDAEVAVFVFSTRLVHQLHGLDAPKIFLRTLDLLIERSPPVDTGGMGEQVADGD